MTPESDYSGRISEFNRKRFERMSVVDVRSQIGFQRFAETVDLRDFIAVFPYTDYAGFHATDPNWYEEGQYISGLLRTNIFYHLEHLFKEAGVLKEEQLLTPVCHYSENPGSAWLFPLFIRSEVPRPNIVIEVRGGENESWGQFVCIVLGERRYFEMVDDPEFVHRACNSGGNALRLFE